MSRASAVMMDSQGGGWGGVVVVGCAALVLWGEMPCRSVVPLGADAVVNVALFFASSE